MHYGLPNVALEYNSKIPNITGPIERVCERDTAENDPVHR